MQSLIRERLILDEAERRLSTGVTYLHMMQTLSPDLTPDSRKSLMRMASNQFFNDRLPWIDIEAVGPVKRQLDVTDPASIEAYYKAAIAARSK